jgi:hypothetical protein
MLDMIGGLVCAKTGEEVDLSKIEALLYVKAESLQAARGEIEARHGDMDTYLIEGLGCRAEELERLRDELLEEGEGA